MYYATSPKRGGAQEHVPRVDLAAFGSSTLARGEQRNTYPHTLQSMKYVVEVKCLVLFQSGFIIPTCGAPPMICI